MRKLTRKNCISAVWVGCLTSFVGTAQVPAADGLVFPWGHPPIQPTAPLTPADKPPPYLILPAKERHAPPAPIAVAPPKTGYAYGWFGSNPNSAHKSHWGRHFGYSKNFTQWTSR